MKKNLILAFLLIPCLALAQYKDSSYAELNESDCVSDLKEQVAFFASAMLEGRSAGSQGELEAAQYLSGLLTGYDVDVFSGRDGELFGLKQENGDTLRSRNVVGFIPGYDPVLRNKYIVIGARLDNLGSYLLNDNGQMREKIYFGANGNASGLALLAQLAQKLSNDRVLLKRSVIICGFGASTKIQAGSWYFLNRSFADASNIDAMINLDMLGTPSRGFYAYTSGNTDMNMILRRISESLQPIKPEVVDMEPCASDHRSFYNSEIPSVFFTTGMYPQYNTDKDTPSILEYDEMERVLEYLYNFSVSLCNGAAPSFRNAELSKEVSSNAIAYYECDVRPTFMGSSNPQTFLSKWVYTYLRYPKQAVDNGIQGKVLVGFTIDENGKVGDVRVLKGVDELLDAEAVRVVSASPDWKPGKVRGKKVKSAISMNIEFRLTKN